MKKLALIFVASLYVTASFAQTGFSVNSQLSKISAVEEGLKDPAKAAKASEWSRRGDIYFNAAQAPIKGLYKGMSSSDIETISGAPTSKKVETVGNKQYDVMVYKAYDLYLPVGEDKLAFWNQKIEVLPNGLDISFESYSKALQMDPKYLVKALPQFFKIVESYKQDGDMAFAAGNYPKAANSFIRAYELELTPNINKVDTMLAYNAGYISILAKDFDNAVKYLLIAKKLGFEMDGEIYKMLYFAYDGKKDSDSSLASLKEGLAKYPDSSELVELLMNYYTKNDADVASVIPIVKSSIEKNPKNFNLRFGLGLIYDKLKDYPNAISEFEASSKISPDNFGSFFNLAIAYIKSAEELIPVINEIPVTNKAEYKAKVDEMNAFYKKALEPLERAHDINPTDKSAVELLKTFYFRFRDESPAMKANYEKYNTMFQNM